jgi:hypothetical protein
LTNQSVVTILFTAGHKSKADRISREEVAASLAAQRPESRTLNGYRAVVDPDDELVCVTVYKRGAVEVIRRLCE